MADITNNTFSKILEKSAERHRVEALQIAVDSAFNPKYESRWALLSVERKANTLKLKWESRRPEKHDYLIAVSIYEISLSSKPGLEFIQVIHAKGFQESCNLKLREGGAYYFECLFYEDDNFAKSMDVITFQMGIPLSPEKKALLNKAVSMELNPEEKINYAVDNLFKKKDAFQEKYDEGVKRIKDKKLRPKVEKAQIQDLKEEMERMKENFGI
jgi:hypothetical protein